MVLGMTGFAEKSFASPLLRVKIGIKTLNHRSFDWSCKGSALGEVESRLRDLCRKKIHRGRVAAEEGATLLNFSEHPNVAIDPQYYANSLAARNSPSFDSKSIYLIDAASLSARFPIALPAGFLRCRCC